MWSVVVPKSTLNVASIEGASPVRNGLRLLLTTLESGCLIMQPKVGGKLHLRLNTNTSPIVNKYREGKLKRTLKRKLTVRETT